MYIPYEQQLEYRRHTRSSPRVRLAARAYACGAVRTKAEAARLAGVSIVHFANLTNGKNGSEPIKQIMADTEALVADETIATNAILQKLGRRALGVLARLMEHGEKEDVQLRAAQDLADRSSETSKTMKHEVLSAHIEPADAKELAKALVESAKAQQRYAEAATGEYVKVDERQSPPATISSLVSPLPTPADADRPT